MTLQNSRKAALQRQVRRMDKQLTILQKQSDTLSNWRLAVAVLGIVVTGGLLLTNGLAWAGWLALVVFAVAFGWLVRVHRQVERSIHRHQLWRDIKQTHIARMTLDWEHIPQPIISKHDRHMLEVDLDLSDLHRLMNVATSRAGADRLRSWLIPTQPDLDVINTRQGRVKELSRHPLFRDKLALNTLEAADDIASSGEGEQLLHWLKSEQPAANMRGLLIVLVLLSLLNITVTVLTLFGFFSDLTLASYTFFLYAMVFLWQYRRVFTTFEEALTVEGALNRIRAVMDTIEQWSYTSMPETEKLVAPIVSEKPSQMLRSVTWVISGASLRANPIFWLLVNMVVPWDYFFGWRMEQVKRGLIAHLPKWLDVWHELEALSSLAVLPYLNPSYTLPRVGDDVPAALDAVQIGHPLIPPDRRMSNDFMLTDLGDIVVITGSNMAGKSSFLRTLGVNLCLAYAGGYVCADGLDTIIFRLYTSIRVTDSLDDGISYFYAEVKRLKGLLIALNQQDAPPVFFLIDEIFRGTNNRERLIGSRSLIRALAEQAGVGLIATHDLELVALADENPRIRNAHFREDVVDGRMVFDYVLRSGPCPTTNALRIMEMEGLPVEDGESESKRRGLLRRRRRNDTEILPPSDTVDAPDAAVEMEAEDSDTNDPLVDDNNTPRRRRLSLRRRNRQDADDVPETDEELDALPAPEPNDETSAEDDAE